MNDLLPTPNPLPLPAIMGSLLRRIPGNRVEIPNSELERWPADKPVVARCPPQDPTVLVLELDDKVPLPEDFATELDEAGLTEPPATMGELYDRIVWALDRSVQRGGDTEAGEALGAIDALLYNQAKADLAHAGLHLDWGEIGSLADDLDAAKADLVAAREIIERLVLAPASRFGPAPTAYEISRGDTAEERSIWRLAVERRGRGGWAVLDRMGRALGDDGEWDWERNPSSRTDDWIRTHRFDLHTALHLAADAVDTVEGLGGLTWDEYRTERDGA